NLGGFTLPTCHGSSRVRCSRGASLRTAAVRVGGPSEDRRRPRARARAALRRGKLQPNKVRICASEFRGGGFPTAFERGPRRLSPIRLEAARRATVPRNRRGARARARAL